MIIVCQKLLKHTKISGITLFPFIFIKNPADRSNATLINHEKIHLRQQAEMLIVFFYPCYILEYFYYYFRLRDSFAAYRAISFEREAYANEDDFNYLRNRQLWAFTKYYPQ